MPRTLIYGAGDVGVALLSEIRQTGSLPYRVIGFVDDDSKRHGESILGVPVLGGCEDLPQFARARDIDTVLIATPSATGKQLTRIFSYCTEAGVSYKLIPGLSEVIEGTALTNQIRDVSVEDLLGRDPILLDTERIAARYEGKVVMVTGAAGSIGSELCRQLARFRPAAIVGYEVAETPLFFMEREMRNNFPETSFLPALGCIRDKTAIESALKRYKPIAMFHAAAYKHVPMMEASVYAAIRNNVLGTFNLASAAVEHGVDEFVMISTDKAARPTSVMGASKRIAEHVVGAFNGAATKFVSVRFGNVLGSHGSVIPIFKKQIADGGPVTVTHPEIRRYFMTIPEASQLVLQAATMAEGGEIFVLHMGEPVKIVDLARNLILLSGLRPDEDIQIEFTGARPGEKLHEEISTHDEERIATTHEKIQVFAGMNLDSQSVVAYVEKLEELCTSEDLRELVLMLREIVPDYGPSAPLLMRSLLGDTQPSGLGKRAEGVASG